jgi:hypothetical protein
MVNEPTSDDLDVLKQENAQLREMLTAASNQAKEYRKAAYHLLEKAYPYSRPSEDELKQLLQEDQGETLLDILHSYRRELHG